MTLVVIMAHKGVEEHCRRHMPFWQRQGSVVFFSPANLIVKMDAVTVWTYGPRGHHTPAANQRFLAMLRFCAKTEADSFAVHEYDSVCFAQVFGIPNDHLAGIAYSDTQPHRKFVGSTFVHPPLMFSKLVLTRVISALAGLKEQEAFMWDRWLGLGCERAGIPIFNLREHALGFSKNTIEPGDIPAALHAISNGACCFHGVKTKTVFDTLKLAGNW